MTKTEFLEHLEKRLQVLNKKERDDILSEYAQHIELKMENGLGEEEAIQDFGNLEELEAEILDAYNVNPDYDKKAAFHIDKSKIKSKVAWVGNQAEYLRKKAAVGMSVFFSNKFKCILLMLLKVCLILGVLFLIYLPLSGITFWIADRLYSALGGPLDVLISWGIVLSFHLLYLIFAIFVLYTWLNGNRQHKTIEELQDNEEMMETPRTEKKGAALALLYQRFCSGLHVSKAEKNRNTKRVGSFIPFTRSVMKSCTVLLIKGAAICFLAPILFFLFLLIILFGIMLVLLVIGYPVIGLSVLSMGGLLSGFALIWFVYDILFVKKARNEK